ncbi:hypothetical protein ABT369_47220 [Dactylosporangium sp. NPDC000244]|uniref:hypothetical protein n=1 Tax=Dactylosporangium sp. NPDC000244 TaxID=3154365 RepID=UPI0033221555
MTSALSIATFQPNEQGDVWAETLEHRAQYADRPAIVDQVTWERFTSDTRRLLLGKTRARGDWHTAFADAGTNLRRLRETGQLTRGV